MGEVTIESYTPAVLSDLSPGRPYKYETHVKARLDEVYNWLVEGYTDYSIADSLGLSHQTWIDYKREQIELIEVYNRARLQRNTKVMNSMFGKSNGHVKTVKQQKVSTKTGEIVTLESEIYTPPDVNAADLYLRNNMPGYVQARQEGSASVHVTVQLPQIQAEIDKLMTSRQALEAELAQIDLLPDADGLWQTSAEQGKKPTLL